VRHALPMETFTIYADWRPDASPSEDQQASVANALLMTDPERCVWVDERKPDLVQVSFDVEADDYQGAIAATIGLLRELVPANGISGALVQVVAMTEEGQLVWHE
jgi:hypothetical protein